jgi:hypothetical protein
MNEDLFFPDIEKKSDKISEKLKRAQSLVGTSEGRPENDFYPTPPEATEALLQREKFDGAILEPACGDGAMSRVLEAHGYSVISRDLIYRGYGEGGHDFLKSHEKYPNVITNPPFRLGEEFIQHALKLTTGKVVMLCKLQFLEGGKRKLMFESTPFKSVYIFSKRLSMTRNGEKMANSGMIAFAWFVWEHGYTGVPTVAWI